MTTPSNPLHDITKITDTHADGSVREVAAYVVRDGERHFYARGCVQEAIRAARNNRDLADATYEIDLPRENGADERRLTFGQPVTLDDIRRIEQNTRDAEERRSIEAAFEGASDETMAALRVVVTAQNSLAKAKEAARSAGATNQQIHLAMHHPGLAET